MTNTARLRERLDALRRDLIARDADSAERLGALGELRDADTDDEHDPDGAPLSGEWSRLEGGRRAVAAELSAVDAALARISAGTYGICARCSRPIAAERLDARPTAELCIECAEALEARR